MKPVEVGDRVVAYLFEGTDAENAWVFGGYERMEALVLDLFENWETRRRMGRAAYETIRDVWNAEYAAKELLRFAEGLLRGEIVPGKEGPLTAAPILRPR